ncbi:methionyl-tRNA formyltransferase, partial [Gluconacetobacter entanii]|nr:methionyl-tRNA formyltransferase [Gluconacetobacter entanii]
DIPPPRPQPEEGVTYAARLTREDGRLHWDKTAEQLDRQVRAMTPWPGTFTRLAGQTIKIGAVMPEHVTSSAASGTVVDDRLLVACGDGTTLRITRLQRPGRGMMEADAFLRGQDVPVGTRFDLPPA